MRAMRLLVTLALPLALLLSMACASESGSAGPTPTPDLEATVEAAVSAALSTGSAAMPTPTNTPVPAAIPAPTPRPTATPVPIAAPVQMVSPLTISPLVVVPRQKITIQGDGFAGGSQIKYLRIGGINVDNQLNNAEVTTSGKVVLVISVPDDLARVGKHSVRVEDLTGRVGEGELTIARASIALSPSESRIGATVEVAGTGFPVGDLVQISYPDGAAYEVVAVGSTDPTGKFESSFVVPDFAVYGSANRVVAKSLSNKLQVIAEAVHNLPDPRLSLNVLSAESCDNINVTGENLPAFSEVERLHIGDVSVSSFPERLNPHTDINGEVRIPVLVPQLERGSHEVTVVVDGILIKTSLTITKSAIDRQKSADPRMTLRPSTVRPADRMEIKGEGFLGCAIVTGMQVENEDIAPVPFPSTDAEGNFSAIVMVPLLELGPQAIVVEVAGKETAAAVVTVVPYE